MSGASEPDVMSRRVRGPLITMRAYAGPSVLSPESKALLFASVVGSKVRVIGASFLDNKMRVMFAWIVDRKVIVVFTSVAGSKADSTVHDSHVSLGFRRQNPLCMFRLALACPVGCTSNAVCCTPC